MLAQSAAACARWHAIHVSDVKYNFIFSSVTTGKGQSDEVCDILVPNELKNAEHLGLTV